MLTYLFLKLWNQYFVNISSVGSVVTINLLHVHVYYSQIRCIALRVLQTSKEFRVFLFCQLS